MSMKKGRKIGTEVNLYNFSESLVPFILLIYTFFLFPEVLY